MQAQSLEWIRLDAGENVGLPDLAHACGMSDTELRELMDYGALQGRQGARGEVVFGADQLAPLREAGKLRRAFDLDMFTVALLLDQLRRIDALQRQLRSLQALLPAHAGARSKLSP